MYHCSAVETTQYTVYFYGSEQRESLQNNRHMIEQKYRDALVVELPDDEVSVVPAGEFQNAAGRASVRVAVCPGEGHRRHVVLSERLWFWNIFSLHSAGRASFNSVLSEH